jgi:glycosyltransferase involved in cell wall biosynthesis
MKIACVVHRYGLDIAGGSETHCRHLAERLAACHEVTVLTTCARDYVSWANAYPAGSSTVGPVRVLRFPVAHPRRIDRFREISERVFSRPSPALEEEEWFKENGPDVPDLLAFLRNHGRDFDRILFWSFRYAPVFFGLPLVADRAILVPTAEEDPAIRLEVLARFFALPRGYIFLTPEEHRLIQQCVPGPLPPSTTIGSGLEPAPASDPAALAQWAIPRPFALYLGRVERNKGCETMLAFFERYLTDGGIPVPLVLAGPVFIPVPQHSLIRPLGFVSDAAREALLAEARVLVMPSLYESLSMVLLEAWNHGVPALVNGRCQVLKGQVRRANGGLYYDHVGEFAEGLRWFLEHPNEAQRLGAQGRAYVDREYRWPTVMSRVERFLADV